ncbi:MAG: stage II sporulation protein M [Bacillota bacterium]|nr:stage II sporulation protein M [Bacillota bacterium]
MKKKQDTDRQKIFYIVCLFFLLGTAGGAAAANLLPMEEQGEIMLFLQQMEEGQAVPSFGRILWKYLKYVLLIWLGGWMQMGLFLSGAVYLFCSASLGFTAAMLLVTYGGRGIVLVAGLLLPQNLLLIPAYVLMMWAALYYMFHWQEAEGKRGLKRERRRKQTEYCILFGGAVLLLAGASGVEFLLLSF